jgi:hypothetical protein
MPIHPGMTPPPKDNAFSRPAIKARENARAGFTLYPRQAA